MLHRLEVTARTDYLALVFHQAHGIRFDNDFDQNNPILVPCADAFHQPCCSHGLLIYQIRELWYIDTRRARGQRGEGEALSHGCEASDVIWAESWIYVEGGLGHSRLSSSFRSLRNSIVNMGVELSIDLFL